MNHTKWIITENAIRQKKKLQREIFHLEEERDIALEDALCWKILYLKKPLYEKVDDKESIVCAISKLQLMLEELEDQMYEKISKNE